MNSLNIIQQQFNEDVVYLVEKDDDLWLTGEQIGRVLDYENPREAIKNIYHRNKAELDEYSCLIKLEGYNLNLGGINLKPPGGKQETRVFNEQGIMIITMLSGQPKAREFRKWAVRILKAYRHGELLAMGTKAQQLILVDKVYSSATRLAKGVGLSKGEAILKAAESTQKTIGVDVFEYLNIEKPEDEKKPAKDFYTALDFLLKKELVKNYCLNGSEIHVRMNEVLEAADRYLGMALTKQDYPFIKRSIRFISCDKASNNRLTIRKPIRVWAFQRI